MKKYKIAAIVFGVLGIISAIISLGGMIAYYYYGSMDMSADPSGGGPVGLPYLWAMMIGGTVGIYAAIFAGINAIIVIGLLVIYRVRLVGRRKEKKQEKLRSREEGGAGQKQKTDNFF